MFRRAISCTCDRKLGEASGDPGSGGGSMHAMLPSAEVDALLAIGWGEPHPMARRGLIAATAVMIYAPRSAEEVETAIQVIEVSYRFALRECG